VFVALAFSPAYRHRVLAPTNARPLFASSYALNTLAAYCGTSLTLCSTLPARAAGGLSLRRRRCSLLDAPARKLCLAVTSPAAANDAQQLPLAPLYSAHRLWGVTTCAYAHRALARAFSAAGTAPYAAYLRDARRKHRRDNCDNTRGCNRRFRPCRRNWRCLINAALRQQTRTIANSFGAARGQRQTTPAKTRTQAA